MKNPFNIFTIAVLITIGQSAYGRDDYFVYVTNEDSNTVSVISPETNRVVATIPVGKRPRGIRVSPDGNLIYTALSGSPKCPPRVPDEECDAMVADRSADGIAEIDAASGEVLRVLPSGSDPEQFDVNWETRRLYVSNEDNDTATILDLDRSEIVITVATGREPEGVRLTPDGSLFYVTGEVDSDVTVIDADSGKQVTRIPVGLRPRDVIFTANGRRAYVSAELDARISVIDVNRNSVISKITLPEGSLPMGLVLSTDESMLYVANGRAGTVAAVDLATESVVASVDAGPRPWGLALGLDGRFLYSANGPSDDVTVIDVEKFSIVTKIQVGETPWGVAVGPAPQD